MPSLEQMNLLLNCSCEWTAVNGINGRKFTAPDGGTIFLPAAGDRWYDDAIGVGNDGYYWSSMQSPNDSYYAYCLYFLSDNMYWGHYDRNNGRSVRPVTE